ncbi:hypothetical protein CRG98_008662 [Punica granatum]|uniref:Uncharacterized protein n=1 Tax=Punica granatum TaxID=22663 RepID=A0A2I0KR38_PUNGR|nr:hypothetical protein CRG98_008662 [Punica granatum]
MKICYQLTIAKVSYVLSTLYPHDDRGNGVITENQRKWLEDDYVCRFMILNAMNNALFNAIHVHTTAYELWNVIRKSSAHLDSRQQPLLDATFNSADHHHHQLPLLLPSFFSLSLGHKEDSSSNKRQTNSSSPSSALPLFPRNHGSLSGENSFFTPPSSSRQTSPISLSYSHSLEPSLYTPASLSCPSFFLSRLPSSFLPFIELSCCPFSSSLCTAVELLLEPLAVVVAFSEFHEVAKLLPFYLSCSCFPAAAHASLEITFAVAPLPLLCYFRCSS